MFGLSILIVLIVYIVIARFILKRVSNKTIKYLLIALFILIPLGDHLLGRFYLAYQCSTDGGLKIYDTADNVEGFLSDNHLISLEPTHFKSLGYKYIEKGNTKIMDKINSNIHYYTLNEDGTIKKYETNTIHSQYVLREVEKNKSFGFIEQQYRVEEINSGKILAKATNLTFKGGWIIEGLNFTENFLHCPHEKIFPRHFINNVLKPTSVTRQGG